MNSDQIQSLFKQFHNSRVLIVGDVMVDSYIIGKVDRVSPEAPVPVVDVTGFENRLGGAGNVALNIKSLGATPILCSVIGTDKEGIDLINIMKDQGLSFKALVQSDKRKTTTKTRVLGNKHQLLRIDHEITSDIDVVDSYLLEQQFKEELENIDDYSKYILLNKDGKVLMVTNFKDNKGDDWRDDTKMVKKKLLPLL